MPTRHRLALGIVLIAGVAVALTLWSVSLLTVDGGGGINTDIVVVLTLAFYAFAIPTIINLARRRVLPVAAGLSDGDPHGTGAAPRPRVTRIGWLALSLGLMATALMFATGWAFGLAIAYATDPNGPLGAELFPYLALAALIAILAAVVVCTIAGTRGRGNRLAGVAGGLALLSPVVVAALAGFLPI